MDHIDKVFATASLASEMFTPAIHASLLIAKKTLNRYYSMTDASKLYHIAMGTCSFPFKVCLYDIEFLISSSSLV